MTVANSGAPSTDGDGGSNPSKGGIVSFFRSLAEWRIYLGLCIFYVVFTLIFGIIALTFLKPHHEPLLFGLDIASILMALGTFAALCFFIQRAKDQKYGDVPSDPNYIDVLAALGIATLFGLSALAQIKELPLRCYSEPSEEIKALSPATCAIITTMGVFSSLGALTMLITCILIGVAIREAAALAKLPPPVFPDGAEASVMRWLDRNDPFTVSRREPQRQSLYGA